MHATVRNQSVDPSCIRNPFVPDAVCETSVAASIELAFLLRQPDNFPAVGFFEGFSSTFLKDEIKQLVNKIE